MKAEMKTVMLGKDHTCTTPLINWVCLKCGKLVLAPDTSEHPCEPGPLEVWFHSYYTPPNDKQEQDEET